MSRILVVTGTDTDVGKTVATAALAAILTGSGSRVAVDKPAQTGVGLGAPGDVDEVARLAGIRSLSEGVRLPAPMAPLQAAARRGERLPPLAAHVTRIQALAGTHDIVLVEGAGGLLVRLDEAGSSVADLAAALDAGLVVVTRAGLGTLNHTELTLEAIRARGARAVGCVIGSWPPEPTPIDLANVEHLERLGVPLLGAIPAHAALLDPAAFRARAPSWLPGLAQRGAVSGIRSCARRPASPSTRTSPGRSGTGTT